MEKKKKYVKPSSEVIEVVTEGFMLTSSDGETQAENFNDGGSYSRTSIWEGNE